MIKHHEVEIFENYDSEGVKKQLNDFLRRNKRFIKVHSVQFTSGPEPTNMYVRAKYSALVHFQRTGVGSKHLFKGEDK